VITNFKVPQNLVLASHITGIYDVNRNITLANDDILPVLAWAESITRQGLTGIIFHNNFSEKTCQLYESEYVHFIKVDYDSIFNPNVFRYFIYEEFLRLHHTILSNIFLTDITDVVVFKNPFLEPYYLDNSEKIFCGDEPKTLSDEWMQMHSEHLRSKIEDYSIYESTYKNEVLLNCGIIGGNISVLYPFIQQLKSIHQKYNYDNDTKFTGDMGAFNYLIRTCYHDKVIHGHPVNTVFKRYSDDTSCWFKHK
jgi:hypothetical protein